MLKLRELGICTILVLRRNVIVELGTERLRRGSAPAFSLDQGCAGTRARSARRRGSDRRWLLVAALGRATRREAHTAALRGRQHAGLVASMCSREGRGVRRRCWCPSRVGVQTQQGKEEGTGSTMKWRRLTRKKTAR